MTNLVKKFFFISIIVHSFVDLAKELLQLDGVEYFLSEKLNQDPLEEHFAKQRGCGGRNDNPTVYQFAYNENVIAVAGDHVRASRHMNCTRRPNDGPPELDPLIRNKKPRK